MRGSAFGSPGTSMSRRAWLVAICMTSAFVSGVVQADDDRGRGGHDRGFRSEHHSSVREHWRDHRDDGDWDDDWRGRDRDHGRRDYRAADWRYYRGRYWAPAYYRGRQCTDSRHFHGVHYHVAARDYYDYYYPRYRYYGPRPFSANASVIITIPLF
jgi:hypothetical protein